MQNVSIPAALIAGLVSFLSPCVLPLVPPYLIYLTGATIEHVESDEPASASKRAILMSALLFVLGFSTVFVLLHFAVARPLSALAVPAHVHHLAIAMAIFSTVLPTWLIAESIRRMGANAASLVGSLGPVFTIGLGAVILNEPVFALQLVGAALVLAGVLLVTLKAPQPA